MRPPAPRQTARTSGSPGRDSEDDIGAHATSATEEARATPSRRGRPGAPGAVEGHDARAGLAGEVLAHRLAHDAEADESENSGGRHVWVSRWCGALPARTERSRGRVVSATAGLVAGEGGELPPCLSGSASRPERRVRRNDHLREVVRVEDAVGLKGADGLAMRAPEHGAGEARHGGELSRQLARRSRQPDVPGRCPEPRGGGIRLERGRHLGPEAVAACRGNRGSPAGGHRPGGERGGAGTRGGGSPWRSGPGEGQGERATVAEHAVGCEGRQVKERAGGEVDRAPARAAAIGESVRQVCRRSRADRRAEGHRPPPVELHPEGVDAAVMVQAHALSPAALHDEQERALFAERAEEAGADGAPSAGRRAAAPRGPAGR